MKNDKIYKEINGIHKMEIEEYIEYIKLNNNTKEYINKTYNEIVESISKINDNEDLVVSETTKIHLLHYHLNIYYIELCMNENKKNIELFLIEWTDKLLLLTLKIIEIETDSFKINKFKEHYKKVLREQVYKYFNEYDLRYN